MGKKVYFEQSEGGHDIVLEVPEEFDMVNIGDLTSGCARVFPGKKVTGGVTTPGVVRVGGTIDHDAYSELEMTWKFDKERLIIEIQAGPNCERVPLVKISEKLDYQIVLEREL